MELDDDISYIGHRYGWGDDILTGLTLPQRRQHVYVLGQTGTGKTTLLRNLILQDIEVGRGVAVIDPHGDLARDILEEIPPWRTEEVVYFDPLSPRPLALNLFRAGGDNWHLVTAGIVSSFKKIWRDSWGVRLEYVLFAALAALIQCENASLLGVSRLLTDERYRAWVVRQVKDPMVRWFWTHEFEAYAPKFRQEIIAPIQNKVGQLFFSPVLRNVLGQVKNRVSFRFLMDRRRIFIANLSKGQVGEEHSSLLGALLVTAFEIAALSRADTPLDERADFFLYVDEFQNCATDSFASMLSEARKYRLNLTLAHQYLGQLDEPLRKAVFGNVGSFIAFRVGEADASALERQFGGEYTASQFSGLDNFKLCARHLNGQPFWGTSLPPLRTSRRRRDIVMRRSRQKYGTRRAVIEEKIDRWLKRRF